GGSTSSMMAPSNGPTPQPLCAAPADLRAPSTRRLIQALAAANLEPSLAYILAVARLASRARACDTSWGQEVVDGLEPASDPRTGGAAGRGPGRPRGVHRGAAGRGCPVRGAPTT